MRSPELASSASLKAAIGLLHGSGMYALHASHRRLAFSPPSQEFLFYYEKWEPPKNKNGERARLVARAPVDRECGSIQQPFSKVMDSLHEIGTRM